MAYKVMAAATAALALLGASGASAATTIDFNSGSGFALTYSEAGVTFTADAAGFTFSDTPNGTKGILPDGSPRPVLRADIAGGATMVSVDLGDFNADSDLLFLDIYDASDVLLGHAEQLISSSFTGMITLSLSSPTIAYAIFGGAPPAINGSSVYADNFTFEAGRGPGGIPEPGTWALMLMGFFGLGSALRRSRPVFA